MNPELFLEIKLNFSESGRTLENEIRISTNL